MKVGCANEAITIISQPNYGSIGIAGGILTSGIISHVVFLYLYDCHSRNSPFNVRVAKLDSPCIRTILWCERSGSLWLMFEIGAQKLEIPFVKNTQSVLIGA